MIEVANLTKDFGATRALDGVSFTVARGETVGLLGPNGSGKTTLMRVLTGFFPPTAGYVRIDGRDGTTHGLALRRRIGYLPEHVVLYPDMRVRQFLRFGLDVRRTPAPAARLEQALLECGLTEVADRLIGSLSKGYRQRVGLAQAIAHQPDVLILDEPTIGLDPRQVMELRALVRAWRGRATVLLSSHVLPEVAVTCERVVIMNRGRLVAQDTAAALGTRVQGDDRTRLRVRAPSAAVCALVGTVPGVVRVDAVVGEGGDVAAGICTVDVHTAAGEATRAALAAAVVARGWDLVELRPLALTLEELFVQLVPPEEPQA